MLLELSTDDAPREMYRPACAILVDDSTGVVFVVIRGTSNIRDALTDLVCAPASLAPGELLVGAVDACFVHDGMWRSAQRLDSDLKGTVWAVLETRPGHRLIITGHSLGAGVASLLHLRWRPLLGDRVSCIAFASPQVLDVAAARAAEAQGVTSLLVGQDVVPRLSLRSATDLSAAAVRFGREVGAADALAVAVAPGESGPRTTRPVELAVSLSTAPALRPAGRLLHSCVGSAPGKARVADTEDFADIQVCRGLIISHLPPAYLRAVGAL